MRSMSVTERVRQALARLDGVADLGAVVARDDEAALAAAAELDRPGNRGVLHGVPLTVKDWIDVAGLPCEGEMRERSGRVPTRDATVVARLRAAGAVVVAKTQPGAHHSVHGQCHHPLRHDRSPGGSSSGEAALIGAGASVLGIGSDSGGSIRLPAAWCGVAGLKPSFGLVPDTGHFPRVGQRFDGRTVIGPMAARVDDLLAPLRVMVGPDGVDAGCVPVQVGDPAAVHAPGMRVAVVEGEGRWLPQPSTLAAVRRAVTALVARGAVVMDHAMPAHLDESLDITGHYWGRRSLSGADIDRHLFEWDRLVGRLTRSASSFDVVIGPVVADVAPLDRPLTGEDYVYMLPYSLAGWPAISVPAGHDLSTGLPLAVQVAAPRWNDHVALAVGSWLQQDLLVM
jgi:amidase